MTETVCQIKISGRNTQKIIEEIVSRKDTTPVLREALYNILQAHVNIGKAIESLERVITDDRKLQTLWDLQEPARQAVAEELKERWEECTDVLKAIDDELTGFNLVIRDTPRL